MSKVPVVRDEKIREKIREALEQGKVVVVAQRDTSRVVKPADPGKILFIAREET